MGNECLMGSGFYLRVKLAHKGEANRISVFLRDLAHAHVLFFSLPTPVCGHNQRAVLCKAGPASSPETKPASTLISDS